jgi:hypothetical protein
MSDQAEADDVDAEDENETPQTAGRNYAWRWFSYHAAQRQLVFRFFLIVAGVIAGGYVTLLREEGGRSGLAPWFGLLLLVLAILFWRLDVRSRQLVNFAEEYLREDEARLASELGETIRISTRANEAARTTTDIFCFVTTFRQVYRVIFVIVGMIGLLMFVLDKGSPIRHLLHAS